MCPTPPHSLGWDIAEGSPGWGGTSPVVHPSVRAPSGVGAQEGVCLLLLVPWVQQKGEAGLPSPAVSGGLCCERLGKENNKRPRAC